MHKDRAFQASSPKTFKRPSLGAAFFLFVFRVRQPAPQFA
jgi:hypothetical protein